MRPLKLTVPGAWWDSLLYKGRLHLFGLDGSVRVLDWEGIVEELGRGRGQRVETALRYAFSESNALYKRRLPAPIIARMFADAEDLLLEVGGNLRQRFEVAAYDNHFPFPHATSAFYLDRIIVAAPSGVWGAVYDRGLDELEADPVRLTPIGANQAWPAYGAVAIAAGDSGLREVDLALDQRQWPKETEGHQTSAKHCDVCDWMFGSVIGTALDGDAVLARYKVKATSAAESAAAGVEEGDSDEEGPAYTRSIESVDNLTELVAKSSKRPVGRSLTWGSRDKLYKIEGDHVAVFRFMLDGRLPFIGKVPLPRPLEALVTVRTALFGIVFEFDDALLVLTSDGEVVELQGEPVNWRVFPRSRRYENHLHVITDDALEVHSFNQDYSVDQYEKLLGTRVPRDWVDRPGEGQNSRRAR